jgi:hypothetical protein
MGEGDSMDRFKGRLGVVTAVRNRTHHLNASAELLSRSACHLEHLIVDWSSEPPVQRCQLPPDPRIRLLRVNGESLWWLSRAYNHAILHSRADWILHCDADCLLEPSFFSALQLETGTIQLAALPGSIDAAECYERSGLVLAPRNSLLAVGGYEPLLVGWGYEDIDLQERLFLAGHRLSMLPRVGVNSLTHPDHWRCGKQAWLPPRLRLEATNSANRMMALWCRNQPPRLSLDDPGPLCLSDLPKAQALQRQRALLAGALSVVAGRYGRGVVDWAPAPWVQAAVSFLGLDPLQQS